MWGVSTNIHAVNKRVAGNAVVNMSRVIIRWFYSLRSKAANSKAISNLRRRRHLLKKEKSKDLNRVFEDFLWDLITALVLHVDRNTLCSFGTERKLILCGIHFPAYCEEQLSIA